MSKKQKRKAKKPITSYNSIPDYILDNVIMDLAQNLDTKSIASKYSLTLDTVYRVYNKNHIRILDIKNSIPKNTTGSHNSCRYQKKKEELNTTKDPYTNIDLASYNSAIALEENNIILLNESNSNIEVTPPIDIYDQTVASYNENGDILLSSEINSNVDTIKNSKLEFTAITNKRIPVISSVYLGMINNRHEMPVEKYIFEPISQKLMFNYDEQYQIAKNRILSEVNFIDGVAQNSIIIYVTGLTCVLATIIKVCEDLKINLTLLHHNAVSRTYIPQVVFNHFPKPNNNCPDVLNKISRRNMYTYNCTAEGFVANGGGYEIVEAKTVTVGILSDKVTQTAYRDITLFTNKSDAWKYYIALVENNDDPDINIYFNAVKVKHERYFKTYSISNSKGK